ncbi:MAG: hypothetical protein JSV80_11100 [Acidobacteriota bacterium]|nr:MAG: hypothetical protein JSV80_11100 [Acidobacteriota bacterium]
MDRRDAEAILARIAPRRALFHYFKDRYALVLLALAAHDGRSLSELRSGSLGRLFRKRIVADLERRKNGRPLELGDLWSVWPAERECYVLTLGIWGHRSGHCAWYQTSRRGYNLVLQLNYPSKHDRAYSRLIRPGRTDPWVNRQHPIREKGRRTMSWSRIDLDLAHGEALIEEVQNDWIREAVSDVEAICSPTDAKARRRRLENLLWDTSCTVESLKEYVESVLAPHRRIWAEATLTAAVWFLREDVGIRSIWYHTHTTGCLVKKIRYRRPPISLYEQLPRRFGFERVRGCPRFLEEQRGRSMRGLRRHNTAEFWRLRL